MRKRIGYIGLNFVHLGNLSSLEGVGFKSLLQYDEEVGGCMSLWIRKYSIPSDIYLLPIHNYITQEIIKAEDGKIRFNLYESIMECFLIKSTSRKDILEYLDRSAMDKNCTVEELNVFNDEIEKMEFKW